MIIRRAEKPDRFFPGSGFTENGDEDRQSLVIRGWQRAGAGGDTLWLVLPDYPTPDFIYAARIMGRATGQRKPWRHWARGMAKDADLNGLAR